MVLENLEIIISLASALLGLLVATVTFLVKFIKAAKTKNYAEAQKLLKDGASTTVAFVEQLKTKTGGVLDGTIKKSVAMSEMKAFCAEHNIKFDEQAVSDLIEEIVSLTKSVNVAPATSSGTQPTVISGTATK